MTQPKRDPLTLLRNIARRIYRPAPPFPSRDPKFDRAVSSVRNFYSNAVAWGTNLLNDARDEYSIDDVTAARLYAIEVTSWA